MASKSAAGAIIDSARIFAALGDDTRLRLVAKLCKEGPQSIAQLTIGSDLTRQAITKHLVTMESAGLARARSQGRERIWELDKKRLEVAQAYIAQISTRWDDALERLRAWVEE